VELERRLPPRRHHVFHLLVEHGAAVQKRRAEGPVLARVVAPAGREHRPPVAQHVEQVELLDHAQRMVEREHDRRGAQLDPLRAGGHVSEEHRRRREHAEAREVVLGDPRAVVAHGLGFDALLGHLEQELVGIASLGAISR